MEKDRTRRAKTAQYTELAVTGPETLLPFLLRSLTGKSRNNIKSMLTNREVTVDGRAETRYDCPLREGQTVRITRSVCRGETPQNQIRILYEDGDLVVIDKPAGLLSMATDAERDRTAYRMVSDYVGRSDRRARIFIVHRLDRDTSGVLLFAKKERLKLALQDNWSELALCRGYVAAVEGRLAEKSGRLCTRLKRNTAMMVYSDGLDGSGQEAVTNYKVAAEGAKYSLLDIRLETGRKNQIRVQMSELGHPVAGDKKYGAETDPLGRLALHANRLEIVHPFTREKMCFEAETPESFKKLVK